MTDQVSIGDLLPSLAAGALAGVLLSLAIAHGLLRTFMEARGVTPWTFRDTAASSVLLTIGALASGAGAAMAIVMLHDTTRAGSREFAVALILLVLGASWMWLGLRALRKLT